MSSFALSLLASNLGTVHKRLRPCAQLRLPLRSPCSQIRPRTESQLCLPLRRQHGKSTSGSIPARGSVPAHDSVLGQRPQAAPSLRTTSSPSSPANCIKNFTQPPSIICLGIGWQMS